MATSKQTAAQKATAQKKADEVAALMGDDESATQTGSVPVAPPAVKQTEPAAETPTESTPPAVFKNEEVVAMVEKLSDEEAKAALDIISQQDEDTEPAEKTGHLVILNKTIQAKDAAGNDVKFIASKKPQDLGEYGDLAIKAGCAEPHKAS